MILNDMIAQLQTVAPEDFAEEWDNVGLLVGDRKQDVIKVFIAFDASSADLFTAEKGEL